PFPFSLCFPFSLVMEQMAPAISCHKDIRVAIVIVISDADRLRVAAERAVQPRTLGDVFEGSIAAIAVERQSGRSVRTGWEVAGAEEENIEVSPDLPPCYARHLSPPRGGGAGVGASRNVEVKTVSLSGRRRCAY